jgi:hypothetical protein
LPVSSRHFLIIFNWVRSMQFAKKKQIQISIENPKRKTIINIKIINEYYYFFSLRTNFRKSLLRKEKYTQSLFKNWHYKKMNILIIKVEEWKSENSQTIRTTKALLYKKRGQQKTSIKLYFIFTLLNYSSFFFSFKRLLHVFPSPLFFCYKI